MNPLSNLEASTGTHPNAELPPPSGDRDAIMGSLALVDLDAPTLEPEITDETEEEKRKKIVNHNTNILKKRFGEAFVKGERLESGGYAGGGARELLSPFMENPSLADNIKRLIPNKRQALSTLKDNHDYITAWLRKASEENGQRECEQPKDPYELAKEAGYELTGPFEDVADFMQYKKDFHPGETICTYNDPEARLQTYHMLWLRRPDADLVMPADQLTPDNLTQTWKDYLRTAGRYDPETDSYDLADLKPLRQDPYGTSSMSIQVSRRDSHVSIKNRYNHTVTNPDNTYGSDLDAIADGLKLAVYSTVGRPELMSAAGQERPNEGYVLDDNGGIHQYYYVKWYNLYLGYYEYIKDDTVVTIDRGAYDMLSPELYVSKRKDGKTIAAVYGEFERTSHEVLNDGTHNMHVYDDDDSLERTYSYAYDEHGNVTKVSLCLYIAEGVTSSQSIHNNPVLTKLTLAEGVIAGYIYDNPVLTEVTIGEGASTWNINSNPSLTKVTIAEAASVDAIRDNLSLTEVTIAKNATVRSISRNPALTELVIAEGASTASIHDNPTLTHVTIGEGASTNYIRDNLSLTEVTIGEGASTWNINSNPSLTKVTIARNAITRSINSNPALTELVIAEGASTASIHGNPTLTHVTIGEGAMTGMIYDNNPDIIVHDKRMGRLA